MSCFLDLGPSGKPRNLPEHRSAALLEQKDHDFRVLEIWILGLAQTMVWLWKSHLLPVCLVFFSGMKDGHDFDGLNCLPQNPYVES